MLGSCGRRHGAPDLELTACLADVCGSRSRQFARYMNRERGGSSQAHDRVKMVVGVRDLLQM